MTNRSLQKAKSYPIAIDEDKQLLKYDSLGSALVDNIQLIAMLIRAGEKFAASASDEVESDDDQLSESA